MQLRGVACKGRSAICYNDLVYTLTFDRTGTCSLASHNAHMIHSQN